MRSFLIVFAVLFGVASASVRITFKQEMTEKLDYCVGLLNAAKLNATAHGFGFYQKSFDNLLSVVAQQRPKVVALAENATSNNKENGGWDLFVVINDINNLVNKAVKTPFPTEHLKASVLYLSAMKTANETQLSAKLMKDVFDVIDQETLVATHPNGWVHESVGPNKGNADAAKLKAMYEALEKTLKDQKVPTFEDHYYLINKINKMVDVYNKNNRTTEGKAILESSKFFNGLTYSLAQLFPIDSKNKAQQYKVKSIQQFSMRNSLLLTPRAEPSYKQSMLDRLDDAWKQLDVAMVKYSSQGFTIYFNVLNGFRARFAKTREVIVRVVNDDAEKGDQYADMYEYEVRSHENTVKALLQNPNSEARTKSYALYAAATNPKDADMLLKTVESLMQYEENANNGLPTGPSSFDKIARQAASDRVQKKYTELREIIAKYVIKTQEDFEQLIQKGNDRVQQLTASGKIQEAQALQTIVSQFNHGTIEMNKAMPAKKYVPTQGHDMTTTHESVHKYYNLAVKQAATYELLEKALVPAKLTIKQDLLNRLDVQEKVLLAAIAKYERRFAHFYVKVLGESRAKIREVRDRVQRLPDAVTEKDASLTIDEVKNLEIVVPSRASNPSPYTLQKANAIYLAAMKSKDSAASQALIAKVNEIVRFEKEIESLTGHTSYDKLARQSAYTELSTKYYDLQASMRGPIAVPTTEENEKLIEIATRKIQELISHGHQVEASTLKNELNGYYGLVNNEQDLNMSLPIVTFDGVKSYFEDASRHYLSRENINALLAKYAYTV